MGECSVCGSPTHLAMCTKCVVEGYNKMPRRKRAEAIVASQNEKQRLDEMFERDRTNAMCR